MTGVGFVRVKQPFEVVEPQPGIVLICGCLTHLERDALGAELARMAPRADLVVDLNRVEVVDVEGLSPVINLLRRARRKGHQVRLRCEPDRPAGQLMRRLGLVVGSARSE